MAEYKQAFQKSKRVVAYECQRCCNHWWGNSSNNTCHRCQKTTNQLPLQRMIGVGWFSCPCGRLFAGFSKGNVTSKCLKCHTEVFPSFIVPSDEAQNPNGKEKKTHYCNVCKGRDNCPIVEAAKDRVSRGSKVIKHTAQRHHAGGGRRA
jgi:hypothetical protein